MPSPTPVPDFGSLVLAYLAEARLSQRQFARLIGRSQTSVSRILRGKRRAPMRSLSRWIKVLDLSATDAASLQLSAGMTHVPQVVRDYITHLERQASRRH